MAKRDENKIGLLSPCGWGNLGDAAIQEAMIHHIQKRIPDATIYGITLNPEDTEKRHNIATFPISTFSTSGYKIAVNDGSRSKGSTVGANEEPKKEILKHMVKRCERTYAFLKWSNSNISRFRSLLRVIFAETAEIINAKRRLDGFRFLIVSGGGQLDDFWGGAWGHPYALFKWAVAAKLTRTKLVFLSVGMSSLDSWLSRWFVRRALSAASYRSYRDTESKQRLRKIFNTTSDPVLPDLAFSLPIGNARKKRSVTDGRQVIGVSPISYMDPRCWPVKNQGMYDGYVRKLSRFVKWLVENEYDVVLFASNKSDQLVIRDLFNCIEIEKSLQDKICITEALTVDELLDALKTVSCVIASRLHGVILSHMLHVPVVAISHDRKVNIHMKNVEQSRYVMNIDSFEVDTLIETFKLLASNQKMIEADLSRKTSEYSELLSMQYSQVLCS